MKIWLNLLLVSLLVGCAIESMPTGGPKDTTPPEIVSISPPNLTTHFSESEIKIRFNEYIKLNSFAQQFSVSPSLKTDIEHRVKGKTLILKISDTLLENTTYTFNFGNSIQDFTEGNALTGFSYVVSTGSYLDSGFVEGTVRDAFTMLPADEIIVLLHEGEAPDSAIFNQRPLYYTTAKADGSFTIKNIPERPFQIFALGDKDFSFQYSPGSEAVAFFDGPIIPDSTRKKIDMRSFKEKAAFKFLRASAKNYGRAELYFKGNPKGRIDLKPMNPTEAPFYLDYQNKDTLELWLDPAKFEENPFLISYEKEDSTVTDTINLFFREKKPGKFSGKFSTKEKLGPGDSLDIVYSHPISSIDKNLVMIRLGSDTLTDEYAIHHKINRLKISVPSKDGAKGSVMIFPGAVTDIFGLSNEDTLKSNFEFGIETDFSNLKVALSPDTLMPVIFEILNEKKEVIYSKYTSKNENFDLRYLRPGKYRFRLIWDENRNGKWDPGNVLEKRQPEWVTYYQESIELRANWLLEIEWKVNFPGRKPEEN